LRGFSRAFSGSFVRLFRRIFSRNVSSSFRIIFHSSFKKFNGIMKIFKSLCLMNGSSRAALVLLVAVVRAARSVPDASITRAGGYCWRAAALLSPYLNRRQQALGRCSRDFLGFIGGLGRFTLWRMRCL
jgi:hypothetical protein